MRIKSLLSTFMILGVLAGTCNIANAEVKIAVVDVPAIVASSSQVKALKDEQAKKAQELSKWLEVVRADIEKQKTQEGKDKLTKKYDADLVKKREANTKEYSKKLAEIDASITASIIEIAKAKGYTLVLTKSIVLYGGDNITSEIKKIIK